MDPPHSRLRPLSLSQGHDAADSYSAFSSVFRFSFLHWTFNTSLGRAETLTFLFPSHPTSSPSGAPGSSTLGSSPDSSHLPPLPRPLSSLTWLVSHLACRAVSHWVSPPLSLPPFLSSTVARAILLTAHQCMLLLCLKPYHGFCLHLESTPGPFAWPPRPSGILFLVKSWISSLRLFL